ncbi:MAG: threonine--tRNA ligase [Planctomycetota bacterium]
MPSEITPDHPDYKLTCLRHSAAHLMAHAIQKLWPDAVFAFGPVVENGFYYDFQCSHSITPEDFKAIEAEMDALVKAKAPFEREEWPREKAEAFFAKAGQKFKVDQIQKLGLPSYSVYKEGDFIDLCRGPHVENTAPLRHIKLMNVSGATFRGEDKGIPLQRVYGTAWETKEDLKAHLFRLEEAKKRDHRKLGTQLELFEFHSELSPGSAFWLPKGAALWRKLSDKTIDFHLREGYVEVRTPMVYNKKLWETSGHWAHYQENMFLIPDPENELNTMALKPMNCPGHMLVFGGKKRSYRELPMRLHDQSPLHRFERSGTLNGLLRVRNLCQDDAHIFVTEDQIKDEVGRVLSMVKRLYSVFGLGFRCVLSTRPAKMMGDPALWDKAEASLEAVLKDGQYEYRINPGDGAFYGPKIDFLVKDSLEREHQCATLQLDFQLPRNFDLKYTDDTNSEKTPIVIHRALYGSFERFIAVLIEHYAGAFPMWLSPVQARVIPVGQAHLDYASKVRDVLSASKLRVDCDLSSDTLGAKLRGGKMAKIPYLLVVGDKEAEAGSVSWNQYGSDVKGTCTMEEFLAMVRPEADLDY